MFFSLSQLQVPSIPKISLLAQGALQFIEIIISTKNATVPNNFIKCKNYITIITTKFQMKLKV
jgi:hypothetical protein